MSSVKLTIIKPGLQTLIQDKGRIGYQHVGVPVSGPLDRKSAKLANEIAGNEVFNPVMEITLLGPKIKFSGACHIAITGASLSPTINGVPVEMNSKLSISAEDELTFGKVEYGCRAYLAVAGTWKLKPWLQSVATATHIPEIFTPDSYIKAGSKITIETHTHDNSAKIKNHVTPFANSLRVRVMPGPEFDQFSNLQIGSFFSQGHRLTQDANRMGYRLDSKIKDFASTRELISSGTVPGTIQITNEGQPIILMADSQTTGGYFRIANVIDDDLDALGQLKPGDEVWFTLI